MPNQLRFRILCVLAVIAPKVYALAKLPKLDARKEHDSLHQDNPPFPRDWSVLEHNRIQARDVNDWEDGDEAGHNAPEQELVP